MTARPEFGAAIAVTQADADAAADLIERYFPTNSGMLSLAGSFRRGHLQGVWPYAFARHRTSTALPLAHPAAPQGDEGELCGPFPTSIWVNRVEGLKSHLRIIANDARDSEDRHVRRLGRQAEAGIAEADRYLADPDWDAAALAPAAIASGREGAE